MRPARTLVVLSALRWLPTGMVIPVLILLLTARELSLAQVGVLMSVYGITTLLMELPTGGLADTWGRRPVIVTSAIVQILMFVGLAFVSAPAAIAACLAAGGLARALSSGPLEAWFVDAALPDDVERGLAHGQMAEALALGLGAVAGGLLTRVGSLPDSGPGLISMSIPFLVAAVLGAAFALAAWLLLRETRVRSASVGKTMGRAGVIALKNPGVRRLMLVALALGMVLGGVELVAPDRVAQLVGSPTEAAAIFGFLTATAFVVSASGAWLGTRLPGRRVLVAGGAFLGAGLLLIGLAAPVLAIAGVTYLGVYLCIGIQGPLTAALLHSRVTSDVRSTMLSVESLALQAGGTVASLAVGWLVTHRGLTAGLALLTVAAILAAGVLASDLRHKE